MKKGLLLCAGLILFAGSVFSSPWPQFRRDVWRSGFSPDSAPSARLLRWRFQTGGQIWSSPAVSGDTLYIGSDDSTVYALRATTSNPNGEMFWSRRLSGRVRASPALAYGFVYVTCFDEYLYCLRQSDGVQAWRYRLGPAIIAFTSSPVVTDSCVYVGSESGYCYVLKAVTGSPTGELVWKYYMGKWMHGSPAVRYGRVFIGQSGDSTGGYYLYCLDQYPPDTLGRVLWRYYIGNLRYGIGNTPAVVDSLVFFSRDDPYGLRNGVLYCLRAFPTPAETLYWSYPGLGGMMSSAAVAYGRVYVGMETNGLIERSFLVFRERPANPPNTELIWRYYPIGTIRSSPAVASGKVFVGCEDNRLYCFNALSNVPETLWTYATGGGVWSSPAVSNGMVFVGSWDRYVYGFGTPGSGVEVFPSQESRVTSNTVFPNPFTSFATVPGHTSDRFALYDVSGRRVGVYRGDRIGEGLVPGVYFIQSMERKDGLAKIVKIR